MSEGYSYFTNDPLVREAPVTVACFLCHNLYLICIHIVPEAFPHLTQVIV